MAKASRFFSGSDSFMRGVEVAQSVSGVWYCRTYGWNGYANAWGKWTEYEGPAFESHGTNAYTGERFEYSKPVAYWGFNKLMEHDTKGIRVRLPA